MCGRSLSRKDAKSGREMSMESVVKSRRALKRAGAKRTSERRASGGRG